MPKNGWFHSHNQNFDVENEAYRQIDDYPQRDDPNDRLKLIMVKLSIEWPVFDIRSIFFITVPYTINNIDESHVFGQ